MPPMNELRTVSTSAPDIPELQFPKTGYAVGQPPVAGHAASRSLAIAFGVGAAVCVAAIVGGLLSRFVLDSVWDDAFMFGRYAGNVVHEGKIAWNPGGDPTYGLTAPLFLAVVVPLRLVFGDAPGMVALWSSIIGALALLVLLVLLLERFAPVRATVRHVAVLLVLFVFATTAGVAFATHATSGMDTTFGMAYVALYLVACLWYERARTRRSIIALGILGGLAYAVRPELPVYTLAVPLALCIFGREKRAALAVLGLTAGLIAAQLGLFALYFHTPVPLPFYAKILNLYGDAYARERRGGNLADLPHFLVAYWPFVLLIGAGVLIGPRAWWRDTSPVEKALTGATLVYLGYVSFLVVPIMAMEQRFFQPTVPVIILLGCLNLERLVRRFGSVRRYTRVIVVGAAVAAGVVALVFAAANATKTVQLVKSGTFGDLDPMRYYQRNVSAYGYWFGLDSISALPDDLVIATTEVGLPGALDPHKQIVDIAGLNNTDFGTRPFSGDTLARTYHPDVIYLAPASYTLINDGIWRTSAIVDNYEYFPAESLGVFTFGISIRRDSPYYPQLHALAMAHFLPPSGYGTLRT